MSDKDKDLIKKMIDARLQSSSERKNVFISFSKNDIGDINLLRGQARNEKSPIEFNDWSLRVPFSSSRAEYIKRGIAERISHCSVTLVYLSDSSAQSDWVDWEIRESLRQSKRVIGLYKGDAPPKSLPVAVNENKIPLVRWTWEGVRDAINDTNAE